MSDKILFVVEGAKTEKQILNNIEKAFFEEALVCVAYEAEIYQLWTILKNDGFLDLFEILKGRSPENQAILADFTREDFSDIYLFFDYEAQASNASNAAILEMLHHFDNETENGKLFLSYPMVEALKDINNSDLFKDFVVDASITGRKYKNLVGNRSGFLDIRKISKSSWEFIISENGKKANFIVNKTYIESEIDISQEMIFDKQIERYVDPSNLIAVLSSFPFFLIEYFGANLQEKLRI